MNRLDDLKKQKADIDRHIERLERIDRGVPQMVLDPEEHPAFKSVFDMCAEEMRDLSIDGRPDDDFSHYLEETVLLTIYGKDVYKWINKAKGYESV